MADRIYGPIRGAGTQVTEAEPQREIVPATLGSTAMIGVFERGTENDVTLVASKKQLKRKMGGLLDPADFVDPTFASLEAPLAAEHFWDHSDGAGQLACMRIMPRTAGSTADKATLDVYNQMNVPVKIATLTAHSGGRWAGQREYFVGEISGVPATDFPAANTCQLMTTTINLVVTAPTMKANEYKGGTLHIHGITTKTYTIVSNTSAGLITVQTGDTLAVDWAAAGPPADLNVTLTRSNVNYRGDEKSLAVQFVDGAINPTAYFGMIVTVDGEVYLNYENLSMDSASPYYWQDVINHDVFNNDLFTVAEVSPFPGTRTIPSARPANHFGLSKVLTATVLTIPDFIRGTVVDIAGPVIWDPTITVPVWGASVVPQTITVRCTALPNTFEVSSTIGNRVYTFTGASPLPIATDVYMVNFTLNWAAACAVGDYFTIELHPLYVNELVGGKVKPTSAKNNLFPIISNTRTTVTVSATDDLTFVGTVVAGAAYRLQWPERFGKGYDGNITAMTTTDYEVLLDPATSPLRKLKTRNMGLVKFAVPGIAKPDVGGALTLQRKCRDFAVSLAWQYRVEIPNEIITELDAQDWINSASYFQRIGTSGNDLCITFFPSFMYIRNPMADVGSDATEMLVSVTGMQLGREARFARKYEGYHKAAAGDGADLPLVTRAPVLGSPDNPVRMDEELLNPSGINCYRWNGPMTAWGDRTLDTTTVMRWKHKRELLSYYVNVMLENYDWAIWALNDPESDALVLAAAIAFFRPEYRKRAIRGDHFVGGSNPAAIFKMDGENNTNATRALGDQHLEVSLRFADVVERLRIKIGSMGVSETI